MRSGWLARTAFVFCRSDEDGCRPDVLPFVSMSLTLPEYRSLSRADSRARALCRALAVQASPSDAGTSLRRICATGRRLQSRLRPPTQIAAAPARNDHSKG